jgi:hypothetical protein
MRIKPLRIGEFLFYLDFSKGIAIPIGIYSWDFRVLLSALYRQYQRQLSPSLEILSVDSRRDFCNIIS